MLVVTTETIDVLLIYSTPRKSCRAFSKQPTWGIFQEGEYGFLNFKDGGKYEHMIVSFTLYQISRNNKH